MKLFFLLVFFCTSTSWASPTSRAFGFSIGGGIAHDWLTLTGPTSRSRFKGWGPAVELGLDIPFSDKFGLILGGAYRRTDLMNTRDSSLSLENATSSNTEGRAGFFWGPVTFGYGLGSESLRIRQVSVTSGAIDSSLSGATQSYFASYNFQYKSLARLGFEASYRTADLGSGTTDATISALMKLTLLLGGE
jgi:hypothetical protein